MEVFEAENMQVQHSGESESLVCVRNWKKKIMKFKLRVCRAEGRRGWGNRGRQGPNHKGPSLKLLALLPEAPGAVGWGGTTLEGPPAYHMGIF